MSSSSPSVDSLMDRASESFRVGDYAHAEALYTSVIAMQPTNVKAYSNRSAVFMKLNQFPRAIQDAEKCTKLDPSFSKGWGRQGAALHALKHYSEAITAYERALQLDPGNAGYQETLAELRPLVGAGKGVASDLDRETFYFRRAVDQGTVALKSDQFDDACRHFTKALSQTAAAANERHVLLANRSTAHLKAGRSLEALDDALECVKTKNNYARGHARLAAARNARGDFADAIKSAEQALSLEPANALAKDMLAIAQAGAAKAATAAAEERERKRHDQEVLREAVESATRMDTSGPASRTGPSATAAPAGPSVGRHSVSYQYCRLCSEYGHTARECPLRAPAPNARPPQHLPK